jgi:hypothetical protein
MYYFINQCRACGSTNLTPVFDLGVQPLANDFKTAEEDHAGFAPLDVIFCEDCTLAQLSVVVDPKILYGGDYSYVTSASATMKRHFKALIDDIIAEAGEHKTLMEVGSNDGALLQYCLTRGFSHVQGVEPAKNLANISWSREVPTRNDFFSSQVASELGRVDVVLARHCFAHMPDWQDFVAALDHVTHKDSVVCIEVPYVQDLLDRVEFDTIYHEHLSYISLKAMFALFAESNFFIYNVIRYPIHGGAILIVLRRKEGGKRSHPGLAPYEREAITREHWMKFGSKAKEKAEKVRKLVCGTGNRPCGYGASAKCTVLMNYCRLDVKDVQFITDNTPFKLNKFLPGTKIPIVEESRLKDADRAIMTAWNYRDEILEKHKDWRAKGGRWIIPASEVEVV